MKHLLRLACLLAALLGLAGCDDSPYSDSPSHAANEFFLEIGESHFQKAFDSAAFNFQARTTFQNFQATARDLGLSAGTVACNWIKEERKEKEVKLTGEVMAANGTRVPVILTVIKERGSWRVFSLHTPSDSGRKEEDRFSLVGKGASFNQAVNRELPSDKALQKLVVESLLGFNTAVQKRSFGEFYSSVSLAWQEQLTVSQLKRAFQPFIDANIDLSPIRNMEAVFDVPAEINADGILILHGHYNTAPNRTFFTLRYFYEFPFWKLYGLEVQIHG
ncbi:MAG: hypothetical protein PHQ12_07360 [Chthoniobacteraceae bacterium]|nr:hypothetical protein [Chthoniobacteraceae bacterium]